MQHHQHVALCLSQPDVFILACLADEPKTATAWHEAAAWAIEQGIEPGAFSRMMARLERRGLVEALKTEQPLRFYQITIQGVLAIEQADTHRQVEKFQEGGYPHWQDGREIIMRLILWILHLYPPAWRERYEQEMIALLEQHQITLWTVLDLLVGALDARLDPHYRRKRQLLPLRRLQVSWKWFFSAVLAFCFSLLFWPVMWGADFPCNGDAASCALAHTMGVYNASLAATIIGTAQLLMIFSLFPLLLVLLGWIGLQARRAPDLLRILPVTLLVLLCLLVLYVSGVHEEFAGLPNGPMVQLPGLYSLSHNGWFNGLMFCTVLGWIGLQAKRTRDLLRTLPVALLVLLCQLAFYVFTAPDLAVWLSGLFQMWWFQVLFLFILLATLVLVAESAGTMFTSLRSWQKRHHLLLATLTRLCALLAIAGMVVVCIATGVGLIDLWNVLPLLNEFSLGMSFLQMLGFIMVVVATVIALVALVRSTLTLRAASAPIDNTSALPLREKTGPKGWIIVLPAVVFVYIELTSLGGFGPFGILVVPLLFVPGSVLFALAVKHYRVKSLPHLR